MSKQNKNQAKQTQKPKTKKQPQQEPKTETKPEIKEKKTPTEPTKIVITKGKKIRIFDPNTFSFVTDIEDIPTISNYSEPGIYKFVITKSYELEPEKYYVGDHKTCGRIFYKGKLELGKTYQGKIKLTGKFYELESPQIAKIPIKDPIERSLCILKCNDQVLVLTNRNTREFIEFTFVLKANCYIARDYLIENYQKFSEREFEYLRNGFQPDYQVNGKTEHYLDLFVRFPHFLMDKMVSRIRNISDIWKGKEFEDQKNVYYCLPGGNQDFIDSSDEKRKLNEFEYSLYTALKELKEETYFELPKFDYKNLKSIQGLFKEMSQHFITKNNNRYFVFEISEEMKKEFDSNFFKKNQEMKEKRLKMYKSNDRRILEEASEFHSVQWVGEKDFQKMLKLESDICKEIFKLGFEIEKFLKE